MGGKDSLKKRALSFFSDRSKLAGRVGGGILYQDFSMSSCLRLLDHCSVFQAEVTALKIAVNLLLRRVAYFRLTILSDANYISCLKEYEIESSQHFLRKCAVFTRSNQKHLRFHTSYYKFAIGSGRFCR